MSVSQARRAKLILERWESELSNKDRTMASVLANFEELFHELWRASTPFDIAYEMVKDAVGAHLPSRHVAQATYKSTKKMFGNKPFQEFLDDWKKSISNKAYQAFYAIYPIDGESEKEEKKFGSMSMQEYSKQRKYADAFPVLNVDELKEKLNKIEEEDLSIDDIMEDQDG